MTNKNSIALAPVADVGSQQSPCWKQKKIIGAICFAIVVALAATLGVVFFVKRPATPPVRGSSTPSEPSNAESESEQAIPPPSYVYIDPFADEGSPNSTTLSNLDLGSPVTPTDSNGLPYSKPEENAPFWATISLSPDELERDILSYL